MGLAYLDGGPDLNTPDTSPSGILDSMGLAHILGLTGGRLARVGPRFPLLTPADVALLGYQSADLNPVELLRIDEIEGPCHPVHACRGRAGRLAKETLLMLDGRVERIVVHFDVGVIDFVDLPIADVPSFHGGLEWLDVLDCVRALVSSPKLGAVVVTEFNPDRDPDGRLARRTVPDASGTWGYGC